MARCGLAVAEAALVLAAWCSRSTSAATDAPHLTVIGDSVLTAVIWNQAPLGILVDGFEVHMDIGICRTLTGTSCPFQGAHAPTLLDVVHALGPQLGPNVVVEVGYNDHADTFKQSVEQSVAALLAAGVKRIMWVNLHEWQPQYAGMNDVLDAAARNHPQVAILDWRSYSSNRYSWFQGDGIHLTYDGAMAMATFLHGSISEVLSPLTLAAAGPPAAVVGRPYDVQLGASGGVPPYRFGETGVRLPWGLRLLASGRIYGTPTMAARVAMPIRVTDSLGYSASRRLVLDVRQPKP